MRLRSITYKRYNFADYFRDRNMIIALGGQMKLDPHKSRNITRYLIRWY